MEATVAPSKLQSVRIVASGPVTAADVPAIQTTINALATISRQWVDEIEVVIHVGATVLSAADAAALADVVTKSAALLKKAQSISTAPPKHNPTL